MADLGNKNVLKFNPIKIGLILANRKADSPKAGITLVNDVWHT